MAHSTTTAPSNPSPFPAVLATVLLASCLPSDRPRATAVAHPEHGRTLVRRSVDAHGGLERWRQFEKVHFHYSETWSAPFSYLGQNPWPLPTIHASVTFWLHEQRALIRFDDAPHITWRLHHGTVTRTPASVDTSRWNPEYALPRTHYLTLLPFKLLDPGAQHTWLGQKQLNQRLHDEVLMTFSPATGKTPEDRYWLFLDGRSAELSQLFLTVTEYHRFAYGDVVFESWQEVEGLRMPKVIQAYYPVPWGRMPLHRGEYSGMRLE